MMMSKLDINTTITLIDEANLESVKAIYWLQERFLPYEWWIVNTSVYGDNREAFYFFFPLLAGLMNDLGVRALWAAIMSEWLNLILKWVFKGDRPYWWIAESPLFSLASRPVLKQFPNSCESGPGMPSGHLMLNVAFFYIAARGLSKFCILNPKKYRNRKILLTGFIYTLYFSWIILITISRLYIQAHFIHQCFFGIIFGFVIGHIAWSNRWLMKPSAVGSAIFSIVLAASSALMYIILLLNGLDPLWSIPLALKHCTNAEYVSIDTQPFFTMVRFSAAAFGLGFALSSRSRRISQNAPRSYLRTILSIKAGVLFGRAIALAQTNLPKDNMVLFLASSFALQLILPYFVIALIPHFLLKTIPLKKSS